MKLKNEYAIKQKDVAKIVAYMKDGFVYENNGNLQVVERNDLNNLILKLTSEQNFMGVNDLIESAKSNDELYKDTISKSVRISFMDFYKLLQLSDIKNMSFSDIIRKSTAPYLKDFLSSLEDEPDINHNKVHELASILEKWDAKKPKKSNIRSLFNEYGTNAVALDNKLTDNIDNLFMKYVEIVVAKACKKYSLPEEIASIYIDCFSGKDPYKNQNSYFRDNFFIDSFAARFRPSEKSMKVNLRLMYNDVDVVEEEFMDYLDDTICQKYGKDVLIQFYNLCGDSAIELCSLDISFELKQTDIGITIDGYDLIKNASDVKQVFYEKLNNDCLSSFKDTHEKDILNECFNAAEYTEKLKEMIADGDYEKASYYGNELQKHQIMSDLSSFLYEVVIDITNTSKVITFTIPRPLLAILELAKDDNTFSNFISDILDKKHSELINQGE